MYRFGETLKNVRKEMNIQQQELARRLGISYVTVSQWESGKRIPKGRTARRIAAALEIPVSELLNFYPCIAPILNCYEDAITELDEIIGQYELEDASEAPDARSCIDEIKAAETCKEVMEDTVNTIVTYAIVHPTDDDVTILSMSLDKNKEKNIKEPSYEDTLNDIVKKMLSDMRREKMPNKSYQLLENASSHIVYALYKTMICAIQADNDKKAEDEKEMLALYRQLNANGKHALRQRMDELVEIPRYTCIIEEND